MNRFKRFITARGISLGLILVVCALLYLSTLIPQQVESSPEKIEQWRRGHQALLSLVDLLHLHAVYTQPWFAAAILLAALALAVSSVDQFAAAGRRLRATGGGEEVAGSVGEGELQSVARLSGYRILSTGRPETLKFVKYPWGYFGNWLLHVGMVLVIAVSSYVALTGRQGALVLVEGERRDPGQPWLISEKGALASPLRLPGSIRLDKVRVSFDAKNHPSDVFSDLVFTDPSGHTDAVAASINRIQHYRGLRIYHAAQYGDAFSITLTGKDGVAHTEKLAVQQPVGLTDAGYSDDLPLPWSPFLLSAKSYADADGKNMSSRNPRLILRLQEGDKEVARTTLTVGGTGTLGEYHVRFNGVERWAKLIIVDIGGMTAVFAGFAIIMLGGLVQYLTPPRELIGIRSADGRYRVFWKAASFRDFFLEERDKLADALKRGVKG